MAVPPKTIPQELDNGYTLELRLKESSTSTTNNTSSISWALVLVSGDYRFGDYRIGWSVSLAGTVVSSQAWATAAYRSMSAHSELTIASGTRTVPHNADGSLTMVAEASMTISRSGYSPISGSSGEGTRTLSGSMVLTNIPRASTLTAANGTLGTAQTLTVNRASASFTHTVTYTCGNASGTIATKTTATSLSWTPPLTLAAQNTTGTTVSVALTLITWNGSTEVGRTVKTVSMAIPASVKPTASATVELVNDNATVNGWGVAVKGYSKYRITTAFTGAQGSTLKARSVTVDATGETLTASPVTTRVTSTARTVRVRVQDSRGRWSDTTTVKGPVIYDYGAPAISEAAAYRCDSGGTADESGTYLRVKCSGTVYTCGGHNGKTVQCRRRAAGGSWSGWTSLTGGTAQTLNAGLDAAVSYEVQFRVSDSLGASRTVTVTVPTAAVALHLRSGGRGAAFGKYAEKDDTLQLAWDLELARPLPIAQGGTGRSARYTTVAATADTSVASGHVITVRHYPQLGLSFCRGYAKLTDTAVEANTWFPLASVSGDGAPATGYTTALSANIYGGGDVQITGAGQIRCRVGTAWPANGGTRDIYFSGWWQAA